jgi:hypothetical protein
MMQVLEEIPVKNDDFWVAIPRHEPYPAERVQSEQDRKLASAPSPTRK